MLYPLLTSHPTFSASPLLTHITIVQLDVADNQDIDGVPVVADYKPKDNAIEMLRVPPPCRSLCYVSYPHHSNPRLHHHQAETMHKMVETFVYDGEQFLACHTTVCAQPHMYLVLHLV